MNARAMPFLVPFLLASPFVLPADSTPAASPEPAAPGALEAWLPEDVIGYAKIGRLGDRLEAFLRSDTRRDLESMNVVRFLLAKEPWQKFQRGLDDFKAASGKDPLQVFQDLLGREVVIAARAGSGEPEVVLLTRAAGAAELEGGLQAIRDAVKARLGFLPQPVESSFKGRTIQSYGPADTVRLGSVFVAGRGRALLEKVIDLAAGESRASVEASPLFRKGRSSGKELISLSVRPRLIPNFHLPEKLENPLGSLLLSGFLGALEKCDLLSASLSAGDGDLALDLSSFLRDGGMDGKYRGFFPEGAAESLGPRLEKRGALAVVEFHRNLSQWWERREDLLISRAAGELLKFEQVMSVVFQGRSFQDEVLPGFGPTITLVARNQEYAGLPKRPRPAIPGFAAIFELKGAEEFSDSLIAGFQTMIGIINADQAQKKKEGMMPMLLKTERVGDVDLQVVSHNLPKDASPGLPYNFTPSMAVVGSRVVLSSSRELARVVVEELNAAGGKTAARERSTDSLRIDAAAVQSILEENRDLLVADSMLKKGSTKEAAEGEIGALFEVLKHARDLSLSTGKDGDAVKLRLVLRTKLGGAPAAAEPPPASKGRSESL